MEQAYHIPVLLDESVDGLNIRSDGDYVDATFGGGGHAREICNRLTSGRLFAFDSDEDAAANIPENDKLYFIRHNFRYMRNFLRWYNVDKVDGILADLGVSSHDFDVPERGFSFRHDGGLDMRMNRNTGMTAANIVNQYDENRLARIFREYGEVENARRLAQRIVAARQEMPVNTTERLREIVVGEAPPNITVKYLAKVFQALRIETNREMEALRELLEQSSGLLKQGGRLVVITYHSLEDRMVKNFLRTGNIEGVQEKDFFGNVHSPWKLINRKVITPDKQELEKNTRARSAKLRIAERL